MGLPLFVAPVDPATLPKPPPKPRRSASPPRTGIRRIPYVNVRDRAALSRQSRLLELQERRRPLPRSVETALTTTDTTSSGIAAAAEYIRNGFTMPDGVIPPSSIDPEPRRQAASDGHDRDQDNSRRDSRSQWWMLQPHRRREQSERDRLMFLGMERYGYRRSRSPRVERPSAEMRLARRINSTFHPSGGSTTTTRRRPNDDVNGLGDRTRSISPEGWDTLLSTLTPDPQPPSADSSFVSNAASQNPSTSFTSTSGQTMRLGTAPEPPCESGCENSDTEDNEAPPRRRHRVSRGAYRPAHPVRFDVPSMSYTAAADEGITQRQRMRQEAAGIYDPRPTPAENGSINVYMARPTHSERQRGGWIGTLSAGATDNGTGSDAARPNAESSFVSTASTMSGGDEDLVSLQRIVRSLASREDIPDEWWTETGLSRRLTRDRP